MYSGSSVEQELIDGTGRKTVVQVRDAEGLAQGRGNRGAGRDLRDTTGAELARCCDGLDGWGEKFKYDSGFPVLMFGYSE